MMEVVNPVHDMEGKKGCQLDQLPFFFFGKIP
jgi:hypothetical protein